MKRRTITPLTTEELATWPTKRLLTRLKQLQMCEESLSLSDADPDEIEVGTIRFKDQPEWREAHTQLKEILAGREHISR